jgi:hypothetical protein
MKTKSTPNLPASSRMQMPSGGAKATGKMTKATAMKGGTKSATKKVMATTGKGMTKKGGY